MPFVTDRYSRGSVERALTHHLGADGWQRVPDGGYTLFTGIGSLYLRTLKEASIFAKACAEKERLMRRVTQIKVGTSMREVVLRRGYDDGWGRFIEVPTNNNEGSK